MRLFLFVLVSGCLHTRSTQKESAQPVQEQKQGERVAAPRPVGTTPESIVRADGMRRIQEKLGVHATGELDDATRKALIAFQRRKELAATGLPDLETVEKLGLDTNDVFQSGSRKQETDSAARKQAKDQAREERIKN